MKLHRRQLLAVLVALPAAPALATGLDSPAGRVGVVPGAQPDGRALPSGAARAAGPALPATTAAHANTALPATSAAPAPTGRAASVALQLRPGGVGVACELRAVGASTRISLPGEGDPVTLPGLPDGALALPIAGRQVLACTTVLPGGQRLLTLVGWDDATLRILGVESRDWHAPPRRSLVLRISSVPDAVRLRLVYDATEGERHESWTDVLAWRAAAPLASAPLRPVLAGTLQAHLAEVRGRVAALLVPSRRTLTLAELGATGLLDPIG